MLIDWFTVGAQALNFVVLVALMKHFLYQPVLQAIATREKRIADQIADAVAKEKQAAAEQKTFEDKNAAFEQQRASLLDKARADASAEAQLLADEAQKAALALVAKHEHSLARQAAHLQQTIAGRAAHEVFAVARKTLTDLANADLESRMVEVFIQHLSEMQDPVKSKLGVALKKSTDPALVRSHYELLASQQAAIRTAIKKTFSADIPLHFETAGDAICGLELSAGGQKLAWTIDEYLRDFQQGVAALLRPASRLVAAPKLPDPRQADVTPARNAAAVTS
jgi:F-type H+-transporting ATPase subunit b